MSRIPVWLSCLFRHKRHHIRESRHPVECITESDQDSSAAVGLDKLPVDIFQCIVDFLPLDSAACLILSRKKLASAIGARIWPALQANSRERLSFLLTMQRDWKEWIICFSCQKLRPLKKCPSLETGVSFPHEGPCTMADGFVELTYSHRLKWHHAHMIMRLNAQNPMDHSWIQALSCHTFNGRKVPMMHCRGRIANGHLLMKMEYRILLREGEDSFDARINFPKICSHWHPHGWNDDLKKTLEKMLECSMKHEPTKPCLLCTSILECSSCKTEFVISVLQCEWSLYKRAVYITAWNDLDSCETPFDNLWRAQCRESWTDYMTLRPLLRDSVQFEPGSIRNAYEELGYPKLKDDGIRTMWPLKSDFEYSRRLEQCSNRDSAFSKIVRGELLLDP